MANIDIYLDNILNDVYGEDVRGSIQLALSAITDEAMLYGLSFKEALAALLPAIGEHLDQFVVPNGTLDITQPGTYDVTNYEKANVQCASNEMVRTLLEGTLKAFDDSSNPLTKVNNCLFASWPNLQVVRLTGNLESIGDDAFYNSTRLQSIYIPTYHAQIPAITSYTFYNSNIVRNDGGDVNARIFVNKENLSQFKRSYLWSNYSNSIFGID